MNNSRKSESETSIQPEKWRLTLYVAGNTPRSVVALSNLKRVCSTHLPGRHEIEIIDLLANPGLAAKEQILAIPTLVRKLPPPIKRIIGDLSNEPKLLLGLELDEVGSQLHQQAEIK